MFLKIVICIVALVQVAVGIELRADHEENGPVAYEFHYSVHDPHTGDIKSQKEVRKNDKVEGTYELIDSDGHRRLVTYKADDHSGFEAVVLREPTDIKIPLPEPHGKILTAHKILAPAPLLHIKAAPAPAPLVHFAPKPVFLAKPIAAHAPQYGNFVSFSGPSHKYNY
ncbi:larval cuticle protein A2B [Stomoxys calcitrans]|uniref:larval cuticle protein A2B n=1 Tax=Stomoxys calcitrans TaxID=35570 RepID=UPI0027E324F7|nr:larval cuticle protein A2B [Stomoxys calcitrans]